MSPALMQSCTALSRRLYTRPCFLFTLVAVAVVTYTTFALNWWNDPQRPSVNFTGKTPDDDQVNTRVLTNRNGVQWEDPGRYHVAYPRGYKFVMDEPEKCRTGNRAPFLVLMAPVAPGNLAARDAIRRTWGNETLVQGKKVQTLFMLGLPGGSGAQELQEKVNQESQVHHDLLQSNFLDSYLNLTIKTMVIMDWLATHCTNATYAMKIDSDMFLNVENLMTMLLRPDVPKVNYLTGMLMWDRPVIRNPNSKWYVPVEMLADNRYPTYTLGMGYVFSNDLPERFVEVSKDIKLFNIEDAYVGACMKKLGLSPTNSPNPWQWKAYLGKYNRCEFSKVITYILSRSSQIVDYWMDLKKTPGSPCS